jgi:hypothetical protein
MGGDLMGGLALALIGALIIAQVAKGNALTRIGLSA